ncbi:MAG: Uma2 family endonuclease [Woronichinia naegeliana WA131]|jgi:Uma2 family endonuclease|uniref:Uma2 family endonuclease n=1 Tax=Woronichinia naegeliana WA131 TaxID=2824559 RepID=A0A977PZJ3_9CYAN|nr:MAG: Uma2 family endonuclease [Woronichinia naegeliana WA131]
MGQLNTKDLLVQVMDSSSFLLRPWTVDEYYQMAKTGILQPDEKVELIAGQIIRNMTPQGSFHAAAITRTNRLLNQPVQPRFLVRSQLPIQLDNRSEPEPDLALVKSDPLDYDDRHPKAEDVYLIIEIADSTLKTDLTLKKQVYAEAKIPDYWVLDLAKRQLYVYRQPTEEGYQQEQILSERQSIAPLFFPDFQVKVGEMLKPMPVSENDG